MASVENLSVEQLESALKQRRAVERMAELETHLGDFKNEISSGNTVEEVYKVCSRFVAKVNNARSVLGTSKQAKGRKRKSE